MVVGLTTLDIHMCIHLYSSTHTFVLTHKQPLLHSLTFIHTPSLAHSHTNSHRCTDNLSYLISLSLSLLFRPDHMHNHIISRRLPPTLMLIHIDMHSYKYKCTTNFILYFVNFKSFHYIQGYLPANAERREDTLKRKREEYWSFVNQYYETRHEDIYQDTFRQVRFFCCWVFSLSD